MRYLRDRVKKILENYDLYREEFYAAYQRFYNLDENFSGLISELELIINGGQSLIDKGKYKCPGLLRVRYALVYRTHCYCPFSL
jgi:hypothetical protein